ncbi:MAG: TOBE domain-containing protein [Bacteroidia bacterium]|nr:TOBE domain-containing protein [Bacteroidia bacterium]
MNILEGIIQEIKTEGTLSVVRVESRGVLITALIIEAPENMKYLRTGNIVNTMFKETEVILARDFKSLISIRNRLHCTVEGFECGGILCKVKLNFSGRTIQSVITREAFDELKIQRMDKIIAMIKTTEVSLAPHD